MVISTDGGRRLASAPPGGNVRQHDQHNNHLQCPNCPVHGLLGFCSAPMDENLRLRPNPDNVTF